MAVARRRSSTPRYWTQIYYLASEIAADLPPTSEFNQKAQQIMALARAADARFGVQQDPSRGGRRTTTPARK